MKKLLYLALLVALLSTLFSSVPVSAAGITISSNAPVSVIIDGETVDKLPAVAASGSRVVIAAAVHYSSENERWTFQKWSNGVISHTIFPTTDGDYKAIYTHEVLVQVNSAVASQQRSVWLPAAIPITFEVPAVVDVSTNVRYRFTSWSAGETPFQPRTVIAPVKPTVLEAKFVKEYFLKVDYPEGVTVLGGGWYPEGSSAILMATDTVVSAQNKNIRAKFSSWESQGYPPLIIGSPKNAIATVKMDSSYTVKANYDTQFLVVANSPFGTLKREWINNGEEIVLETLPIVEISAEQERFIFRRWDGMAGLISPKVSGIISAPVVLTAVYDHQVMVTVNGPEGISGAGWNTVDSTATITAPKAVGVGFAQIKRFKSFPGYEKGNSISFPVTDPVVITPIYSTGPDFGVLLYFMIIPVALIVAYVMIKRRSLG